MATSLGGWTFFVALSVYAYDAGGASAVGVAAVVRMAPAALAAPAMSMLGDRTRAATCCSCWRWCARSCSPRRRCWCGRTARSSLVFALAAVFTALGTGHKPAQAALLPSLADDPRQLAACNAVWSAVDSVGFLAGALGGGPADRGRRDVGSRSPRPRRPSRWRRWRWPASRPTRVRPAPPLPGRTRRAEEIAEGFRAVGADPGLRLVVGVLGVSTLVEGAIDVLVVLDRARAARPRRGGVGWLNAAWGVGGVIGGAGAVLLLARGRNATGLRARRRCWSACR